MTMTALTESDVEEAALSWFADLGYTVAHGDDIAPEGPHAERESFGDVLLLERLRDAIYRLNPTIPQEAREDALRKVVRPDRPTLIANNRAFHAILRDGVEVEYRRDDGTIAGDRVGLIDYENPDNNDWLAVNQFTVIVCRHSEGEHRTACSDGRWRGLSGRPPRWRSGDTDHSASRNSSQRFLKSGQADDRVHSSKNRETRTPVALRDALLPKLMSGELRVERL